MNTPQTPPLVNPLMERLRGGGLGLVLMIRHARTVDIALAARTCGFDALSALYPRESEEKRLLDAMLLAVPR